MLKKQNILWTVTLVIGLALISCIHDNDTSSPYSKDNAILIRFTLPTSEASTRSVSAQPGENNLNDLTLLFFEHTTNATGSYVGYYKVPREDIPTEENMYGDLNNLFDLEIILQSSSGLTLSNAYNILVFANLGAENYFDDIYDDLEFDEFIQNISRMDENDVRRMMKMEVRGVGSDLQAQYNNDEKVDMNHLPMSATATKAANSANVDCKLIRVVVRYDVINKAENYTLVSASIWNAFPKGYVFEHANIDYSYNRLKRYYGLRNEQDGLGDVYGGLYSFENVSTNPTQKDEKTTCLILGLVNDKLPEEGISYYRVNINPKVTGQYLTRNNVYQVTISSVNGKGAPNEPDAYNSEKVLIETSINSWDRDEDGLIVRNETHMMAIPTKRTYFGPEAAEGRYFIYTMGEGTLTMSVLSMPDGIEATLIGNNLHVEVSHFGGDKRTGAVRFNFAGLTAVMEIIQSGETCKTLKLSHTQVNSWPAGTQWIDRMGENPVEVESSGPWTAEIYNGNFSFANGQELTFLYGGNGDKIEYVYNTSINSNPDMRHSFILVTLDEDPENYRNVIVLTQLGSGNFTINPNNNFVGFNPDGTLYTATDTYIVYPGTATDTWTAEISGKDASAFSITFDGASENGKIKGQGSFTINAPGDNFDGELEAVVTVIHNDINRQTIALHKDSYHFSLSHTALTMSSMGGETVPVVVNCTKPTSTWNAVIQSNIPSGSNMEPFLVNANGQRVTSLVNQSVETTFRVWMSPIISQLNEQPKATVKVTLDNGKEAILTVTQDLFTPVKIYAQTMRSTYGNWANTNKNSNDYKTFGQWANEMTTPANFGPSGTVYTLDVIDVSRQSWEEILYGNDNIRPRIINMNGVPYHNRVFDFSEMRNNPNTVFIMYGWETEHRPFYYLGLENVYTINPRGNTKQVEAKVSRKIYTADPAVTSTELWDYIFNTGPFGSVTIDNVALHPQYFPNYMLYLTGWPDTFIPLMWAPDQNGNPIPGTALIGIDPTNRIIWIGHKDLFGIDSHSYSNWNNTDNLRFLQNLIAWSVNVANYGDAFNNRFKISGN